MIQEDRQGADRPVIRLDLALVHYPVCNKHGETIGSAVTNLDLHDIARAGRTFGIDTLYIVTPFADQQALVKDILEHWQTGHGASYNPKRKEALSLVRICHDLAELYALVEAKWQQRPAVLATSAKPQARALGFAEARQRILAGEPHLILFGTGWGMTPEVLADVDGLLPPIAGFSEYNHLSVRSAAAIVLDRVLARQ
ncbi:RNA methyltransferase [Thiovibrio frasassiensis]|uniref:RNA methyltransferase n=1 Tax=Thiovibrio frasassiensis TaxID=2984131 RepID=A0A9X4MII8_9BACT|nr:RNA methyltransferase [Thiovibrio frasassiensis]MDG4477003.1 RNA methyltransferase [Thiovibrio frasassiensis]